MIYLRICVCYMRMYLLIARNTLLHDVRQRPERNGRRVVLLLLLLMMMMLLLLQQELLLLLMLLLLQMMSLMVLLGDDRPSERASLLHPGLTSEGHLHLLSSPRVRRGPGQLDGGLLRRDACVSGGIPRRVPTMQRRGPSLTFHYDSSGQFSLVSLGVCVFFVG